ncbi:glycosyltransferase family 2 protein [Pseudomonas sp. UBA6310]|uniref:glycosyltransferase family 2 protein n=1 Tax=Pseudomonas sp. UBA6310 TaxID=1947327 RepID=UPI00257D0260|nr:glycosyltransferase family 2 protein [Pseudomonas sp. UBA6310]
MENIKYSVIVPTLGRAAEVEALLNSIAAERYSSLEVIVVDQNADDRLVEVINKFTSVLDITHLKVSFRGASRARNYGARRARGEFFFFPDDDAEILPGFFQLSDSIFDGQSDLSVLFGRCVDRDGKNSVVDFCTQPGYLTLKKHAGMFVEATMVIKRKIFSLYEFDEFLGVGTFHGAEEAYDLVLRLLYDSLKLYYTPELKIYHPNKIAGYQDPAEIRRVFSYRCGFARLCVKHRMFFRLAKRVFLVSLYLFYLLIFNRGKLRYYLSEMLGIFTGIIVR